MLELVPPRCYRRNIAEAAIKNFKNHLISILAGADPNFPLTNDAPTISAQAHLFRNFDFNRMLLAPMRCAVQIHEESSQSDLSAYTKGRRKDIHGDKGIV